MSLNIRADKVQEAFRLIEKLQELRNSNLSLIKSFEEFKNKWENEIAPIYFAQFYNGSLKENDVKLFRATRLNWSSVIPDISSISYPLDLKYYKNRCSWRIPVLYTSDHPKTALFECQPRSGDGFYISSWKINDSSRIRTLPLLYNYNGNNSALRGIKIKILEDLKDYATRTNNDFEFMKFVFGQLTECFLDSDHFISSFLSDFLMNEKNECNAIWYPSIAVIKTHINIAFHHKLVDEQTIEPKNIILCRIKEVTNDKIYSDVALMFGTFEDGKIIFENVSENFIRSSEFGSLYEEEGVK